jgi:hypothetical protein
MVLVQENMRQRGAFEYNFAQFVKTPEFKQALKIWLADVRVPVTPAVAVGCRHEALDLGRVRYSRVRSLRLGALGCDCSF